eukprot:gene17336-22881_t
MSGVGPKSVSTFSTTAPSYYVAGIGRGAVGFTTRSDIGPARPAFDPTNPSASTGLLPTVVNPFVAPNFGQAPVGYVAGRGRGMGELAKSQGELKVPVSSEEADKGDYSDSNYDEFSGYGERLFATGTPYEEDDREADEIYQSIDKAMASRNNKRQREDAILNLNKAKSNKTSISEQFADLKRELGKVSAEEWDSIPEVGDNSLKLKQPRKKDIYTPVPDSLIENSAQIGLYTKSVDPNGFETSLSRLPGTQSVTAGLAEARGNSLTLKLDKISDSITGQTVVDPKGYLTNLNSLKITSDAEIGDIKKARALLNSVTTTNPKHAPGWIAAARVEEFANKLVQARKVIRQGCEFCSDIPDVWLEAVRLHPIDEAKAILAQAVKKIPNSVDLWIKAADLETNTNNKKEVLRKALELIPNSVTLWKSAIELEDVNNARILLARAVECVPHSIEMWLALAKLESHENARKILNLAREANPTEALTWITAAKLEEVNEQTDMIDIIIRNMIGSLQQYQVAIDRDTWIRYAIDCEMSQTPLTCSAIVKYTIGIGVEIEDQRKTWLDDAQSCLTNQPPAIITARAIYKHAISVYPSNKHIWSAYVVLEKDFGTKESIDLVLTQAVENCPTAETLWLIAAKEKWNNNDIQAARDILTQAFSKNPHSEAIWLAACKLEWENNFIDRTRILLQKAREFHPTERIYMKSILLERESQNIDALLNLLTIAIDKYPNFLKFYMIGGQVCFEELKDYIKAKEYYQQGLKISNQSSIPLWKLLLTLEESYKGINKARSVIELARLKLPSNDEIALLSIRLERKYNNHKLADNLLAKALQDNPKSGILWAEDILTCNKHLRKSKSVDAIKQCDNDPIVILAIARLFEKDNKLSKARKWYERAVTIMPKLGDAWAYYYIYEFKQSLQSQSKSNEEALHEIILKQCIESDPNRGELWCSITKRTDIRRADIGTKLKKVVEIILADENNNTNNN